MIKILLVLWNIISWERIQRFNLSKIILAINCGSETQFKSIDGFTYIKDQFYKGKTEVTKWSEIPVSDKAKIKYTHDRTLYMTERWDKKDFEYNIPFKNKKGLYTLVTQHSENAFSHKLQRITKIKLGNCEIVTNLDVAGKVGRFSAVSTYTEFKVKGGRIYHKDILCKKGYSKKSINIIFVKTSYDNPQVQGIILVKGGLENTDYHKLKEIRNEFDEIYQKEVLKSELIENFQSMYKMRKLKKKIRNDYEVFFDKYDYYIQEEKENFGINKKIFINIFLIMLIIILSYFSLKIKIN